ncbi:MAG: SecC motif-containing protein [Enterovibrio sp.]
MALQHAIVANKLDSVSHLDLIEANTTLQKSAKGLRLKRFSPNFCGLTPEQLRNWIYAPIDELQWVTITAPDDISIVPVMRYLKLIFDTAIEDGGSLKATSKGYLPLNIVKQASEMSPDFAASQLIGQPTTGRRDFAGNIELNFKALHYTHRLASLCGIVHLDDGRIYLQQEALEAYKKQGIQALFKPMLAAAINQHDWKYFIRAPYNIDLHKFWVFMLWRLQKHSNVEQLVDEFLTTFQTLFLEFFANRFLSKAELVEVIEDQLIGSFLHLWGLAILEPRAPDSSIAFPRKIHLLPLLGQTFQFSVGE